MAETEATIGHGTIVEVDTNGDDSFPFKLGEIKNVPKPNPQVDEHEATHMESPDGAKEFIPGLKDYGEIAITLNWIDGGTTDEYIEDWIDAIANRPVRITGPTGRTRTFPAFPKGWSGEYPVNGVMEGELTLRIAGAVVRNWSGS